MREGVIRAGGLALIAGAVLFMAVFAYLAASFNYPDVLEGKAADVLPALLATGDQGRAVWALYSLLPLLWIPGGVGAFHALRDRAEGTARLAMHMAVVSAIAMVLGLMRWPSLHWELAQAWNASPEARPALEAIFNGANSYLGNYIGEFLGELTTSLFFLLSSFAMFSANRVAKWIPGLGVATAILGLVGMFRNAVSWVGPVAEVNNYLLPVWMIIFGVVLLRGPGTDAGARAIH